MLSHQDCQRILVIRRDNIGDLVCTTPLLADLRLNFPDAEIGVLANAYNAPVLNGNPDINHVFVYQKLKHVVGLHNKIAALWERIRLIARLRAWRPDVTILAKSSCDKHGLRFAHQIKARRVIGFNPPAATDGSRPSQGIDKTFNGHEVEEIGELLSVLGLKPGLGPLRVYPNNALLDVLKASMGTSTYRIGLQISAREVERQLGLEKFIELARQILDVYPEAELLLFWAPGKPDDPHHPGDDAVAAQILEAVRSNRLHPMTTPSLDELIAAISLCDIFISADGGAMHLAAGLNVPTVALFENAPAKLTHWYPWRVMHQVVHGDAQAVSSIEVSQIMTALGQLKDRMKC